MQAMTKLQKLYQKYKRRRGWNKLTEKQKQAFIRAGLSPEQLEEKERVK